MGTKERGTEFPGIWKGLGDSVFRKVRPGTGLVIEPMAWWLNGISPIKDSVCNGSLSETGPTAEIPKGAKSEHVDLPWRVPCDDKDVVRIGKGSVFNGIPRKGLVVSGQLVPWSSRG